jgi:hypothetical protein
MQKISVDVLLIDAWPSFHRVVVLDIGGEADRRRLGPGGPGFLLELAVNIRAGRDSSPTVSRSNPPGRSSTRVRPPPLASFDLSAFATGTSTSPARRWLVWSVSLLTLPYSTTGAAWTWDAFAVSRHGPARPVRSFHTMPAKSGVRIAHSFQHRRACDSPILQSESWPRRTPCWWPRVALRAWYTKSSAGALVIALHRGLPVSSGESCTGEAPIWEIYSRCLAPRALI